MSDKDNISNLIWIIAIVILLTFLIVVISWMSSGKLRVEKTEEQAKTTEISAEDKRFAPESKFTETDKNVSREENLIKTEDNTPQKEAISTETEKEKEAVKETPATAEIEPQPVVISQKEEKKEETKKQETDKKPQTEIGNFALQVGAFSSVENAKSFEKKLFSRGYKTAIRPKGNLTAVLIVDLPTREEAQNLKEKLAKENIQSSIISNP